MTESRAAQPTDRPVSDHAPMSLRLAKGLYRRGWRRAPGVILRVASGLGRMDRTVRYQLPGGVVADVPIDRNPWDRSDVLGYETAFLDGLSARIAELDGPVTMLDCGADIGLVTLHVASRTSAVTSFVALEPNDASYPYTRANVERLAEREGHSARAIHAAVGAEVGRGTLRAPDYDPSNHAWFLESDPAGDVEVVTVDSLGLPPGEGLALKVDVEGGELDVLLGARTTLGAASGFVVALEAHRQVMARTGRDPVDCLRLLEELGARRFEVSERPGLTITTDRPLFDQLDRESNVYNIVCS